MGFDKNIMRKVSEILKEEREYKGYSLEYIEQKTKIKKEYLLAIEEGRYYDLPSESYALGFIKNYADFLGFPRGKITAWFRREYEQETHEIIPEFRKKPHRFKQKSLLNSKIFFIIFIVLMVIGYILFQYNSFIFGPPLSVSSPKNGELIQKSVVQVVGKTDPYATVMVDGEEILVQLDGSFKKSLFVFPGNKTITIIAKNRFGKETRTTVNIRVQ